jgi:gamma-glutamyl-gamma-aminobutyraldehyde dehydrogenase
MATPVNWWLNKHKRNMSHTKTQTDWAQEATRLTIASGLYINGRYVNAQSGHTMDCVNPATGKVIAVIARGQAADVDAAVASAKAAWKDGRWRKLAPRQRMAVMQRWADLVEQHASELALLETLDMGKPISDVINIDIPEVLRALRYFAECIDKIEGAVTHTAPDRA